VPRVGVSQERGDEGNKQERSSKGWVSLGLWEKNGGQAGNETKDGVSLSKPNCPIVFYVLRALRC